MKKKILALVLLLVAMAAACLFADFLSFREIAEDEFVPPSPAPEISFSLPTGIYTESIEVVISAPNAEVVYYTLTGAEPTERDQRCLDSIRLTAESADRCYCVAAKGKYADGSWTETVYATYYVGLHADERFDTPVVFLSCDPSKLFGYESGILITGKLRDDFVKYNPGAEVISISPAGFNLRGRKAEREVWFEMVDESGTLRLSQSLGVRPFGAYSRARKLKSLKLFPRYEYSPYNKLSYPFFENNYSSDGNNLLITEYKRLVMHSSGNDNGGTMMKNAFFQSLATDSGFPDTTRCIPISVYINGSYYGFMWMMDSYCDEYLEDRYGKYEGTFEIVSGPERSKPDTRYETDNLPQYAYDDFNFMYQHFSSLDLTLEENYEALRKTVDVENYLFYYAINATINNNDWPSNNHKAYRYYRAENEEYREGTVFDGRWRFMIHDVDNVLTASGNILNVYLLSESASRRSPLFQKLMEREDCRAYYCKKCMELVNGAFSEKNQLARLEEMDASRKNELNYALKNSPYIATTGDNVESVMKAMRSNASQRLTYMISELKKAFGLSGKTYKVTLEDAEYVSYLVGDYACEEYSGKHLAEYGIDIKAVTEVGYRVVGWRVNGEEIFSPELHTEGGETDIVISPIVEKIEEMPLVITEISSEGKANDYIVLYNPNDTPLSTVGYGLSDDPARPTRFVIPSRTIAPHETLTIYGNNNISYESMRQIYAPFNLGKGETLVLSFKKEIIQSVTIPNLHAGNLYRMNLIDGEFYESIPETE